MMRRDGMMSKVRMKIGVIIILSSLFLHCSKEDPLNPEFGLSFIDTNKEDQKYPIVLDRTEIPYQEMRLRYIAMFLSKEMEKRSFRRILVNLMEKSPFEDNAIRWSDLVNVLNLGLAKKDYDSLIKINFPIDEHFIMLRNRIDSEVFVTYSPLADDQYIRKIVAFHGDSSFWLDAWGNAPEVPTLVVSMEPIVRSTYKDNVHNLEKKRSEDYELNWCDPLLMPNYVYLRSFKFMVSTEPWFLQPAEIYFIYYWQDRRSGYTYQSRLPSYGNNTWWSARKNREKVITCPGRYLGGGDVLLVKIYMYEDDSHPPFEWGSDDFIGGECSDLWNISRFTYCPGYSNISRTFLKRNYQQTAYIRVYLLH